MKKLLALTLAALLIFTLIACNKKNEDATEDENNDVLAATNVYENFTYDVNEDGELEITGYQNANVTLANVTIPAEIDGRRIVGIGASAFANKMNIASVTFPETITYIADYAFTNCDYLTALNLPKNLTTIGAGAFEGCNALANVSFPASLCSIGTGAFKDCVALNNFVLPEGLLAIEDLAFWNCKSLTKVTVPTTVIDLGDGAFYGCSSLYEVNLLGDKKADAEDDAILTVVNNILSEAGVTTLADAVRVLEANDYYLSGISTHGAKFIWDKANHKVYGAMTAEDEALLAYVNEALKTDDATALETMIDHMRKQGFDLSRLNASVASDKFVWNETTHTFTTVYTGKIAFSKCSENTIISVTEGSVFAEYAKAAEWITVDPATAPEGSKIFSNNALTFYYPEAWEMTVTEGTVMIEKNDSVGMLLFASPRDLDDDHTEWGEEVFADIYEYFYAIMGEEVSIENMEIEQKTLENGLKFTKISCTITDEDGTGYVALYLITIENTTYEIIYAEQPAADAYYTAIENSFASLVK